MTTWEEVKEFYKEQIRWEVEREIKMQFLPALKEVGLDDMRLATMRWTPYEIAGIIIATIREQRCKLDVARTEYRKLQRQRAKDAQVVMKFINTFDGGNTP